MPPVCEQGTKFGIAWIKYFPGASLLGTLLRESLKHLFCITPREKNSIHRGIKRIVTGLPYGFHHLEKGDHKGSLGAMLHRDWSKKFGWNHERRCVWLCCNGQCWFGKLATDFTKVTTKDLLKIQQWWCWINQRGFLLYFNLKRFVICA